jgi:C-terminal four TMM region of protein-O-mannosyltransferase
MRLPFWVKYFELQRLMFYHNNALTSSHPYASQPISWPFLLRGVSFWTKGDELREQIYFLGNPVGWWIAVGFLAIFTGILSADQLTRRRGIESIEERTIPTSLLKANLEKPFDTVSTIQQDILCLVGLAIISLFILCHVNSFCITISLLISCHALSQEL